MASICVTVVKRTRQLLSAASSRNSGRMSVARSSGDSTEASATQLALPQMRTLSCSSRTRMYRERTRMSLQVSF